jgi:hypothetical protein
MFAVGPGRFQLPSLVGAIYLACLPIAAMPSGINTSVKSVRNPSQTNTYKIAGLKLPVESTLTKKQGAGVRNPAGFGRRRDSVYPDVLNFRGNFHDQAA